MQGWCGWQRPFRRAAAVPAVAVVMLALASCGGAGDTTTSSGSGTTATTSPVTSGSTAPAPTDATTTSSTAAALPGEPLDLGFPRAGDTIAVVGVAHDDVLNVRLWPGVDAPVVATLAPTAEDLLSLGRHRQLPGSIWHEVEADGVTGWVDMSFIAYLGAVDDVTSRVVADLGGIPSAETMLDLGLTVARSQASTDPESRVVMSVAPTVGDLGEVTYDVIGLGDDAVRGLRLHVFGQPDESGEGFTLKSVESTVLCGRGVTEDGLCI